MEIGIPQGLTLSPVLFLFFISDLLQEFQGVNNNVTGFGFVDDTTLITWGNLVIENCKRLIRVHERCIVWAKRFGARFALEKYQLIHFTKQRKISEDLKATIKINNREAELVPALRVLGVWLDPSLSWKEHIKESAKKGEEAFKALARISALTWGILVWKSKLIYSIVVRPIMTYGAQIWATQPDGSAIPPARIAPIQNVQNKCLRKVLGAYKRTPVKALEKECKIPLHDLYINSLAL